MLCNLNTFFTNNMSKTQLRAVSTATSDNPDVKINAMNTRYQGCAQSQCRPTFKPRNTKPQVEEVTSDDEAPSHQKPTNSPYCLGCGTYGHELSECRFTGRVLHIKEWIASLRPDERKKFLKAYAKDRAETHARYKKGLLSRKQLKLKIRQINIDAKHSIPAPSDIVIHEQVVHAINKAKTDDPDLDFGSMDAQYVDFCEPEIDPSSYDSDISLA
jgi:hypothetical protein